jgi:REP element-mobilizing transposase RayT
VTKRVHISGFIRGEAILQRGYYEHVVRNKVDLENIREYIANNPARWSFDREYINQ